MLSANQGGPCALSPASTTASALNSWETSTVLPTSSPSGTTTSTFIKTKAIKTLNLQIWSQSGTKPAHTKLAISGKALILLSAPDTISDQLLARCSLIRNLAMASFTTDHRQLKALWSMNTLHAMKYNVRVTKKLKVSLGRPSRCDCWRKPVNSKCKLK